MNAEFHAEREAQIKRIAASDDLKNLGTDFVVRSAELRYSYNFDWLGRPVIQYPQDIMAMQEILWRVQPDLVIETGIAHGGSLILYASLLELNAICGGPQNARVLGIDIDIRESNRTAIESHPLCRRIEMIEGSSVDQDIVHKVHDVASHYQKVVVILDSNHTHEHVLNELRYYSPLVTCDSYLIVFDTIVEFMPDESFPDRPWGKGDNPHTALMQFLTEADRFEIDHTICDKLVITVAPDGYLKCLRD